MTQRIVLVALVLCGALAAGAAEVEDDGWSLVPLTLKKEGGCSGTITVTERTTRYTLASCNLNCDELTVSVPAGTWVNINTSAAGRCAGGFIYVDGKRLQARKGTAGYLPGSSFFRVGAQGHVISTAFEWNWMMRSGPYASTPAYNVGRPSSCPRS